MQTKYAVIDIETTGGLPQRDRVIEIGIILYDGEKETGRFESLIDPGFSIPPQITRLTGITSNMVSGQPKFYEVAKQVVELTQGAVFVAHNVRFDYNFIREEFSRLGYTYTRKQLCTKRLARLGLPGLGSYSLESLIHHLDIKVKHRHRALDDAYAACAVMDHVFRLEENREKAIELIHQGVRESRLPASISLDYLHGLPEACGIYYFHNSSGDVIYVGKSKNIKDRILQHFADHTQKATNLQQQVDSITYEITGSELLALLRENEEIKKIKPEINRALRKKELPYGIYVYVGEEGFIRYEIDKLRPVDENALLIKKFSTPANARSFLSAAVERYRLCQKLTSLERFGGPCFYYQIGKCSGACLGEETAESYNERALLLQEKLVFPQKSFLVTESGRSHGETTLLCFRKGICIGYQYMDEFSRTPVNEDDLVPLPADEDTPSILRNYFTKNPRAVWKEWPEVYAKNR